MPVTTGMKDHVYKILELVGSSEKSIEDAIQNALTRASKTIRDMKWFEVVQTRDRPRISLRSIRATPNHPGMTDCASRPYSTPASCGVNS